MADRFICIHGHFYQPPRENPWLEEIEIQDSAAPFHDWNERIHVECYLPNTAARILDDTGHINLIINNYAKINFNFGPTLLHWMSRRDPGTYKTLIESDRQSARERGGHGNALAQVYNHLIMPLANRRDKVTQVVWGLRDFERRFGRSAEGMWLSETAVDTETLEVLAERGVKFTILSPHQAHRVRPLDGSSGWQDVSGAHVDPSRAYRWISSQGLSLDIFFYDGPISQAVAFEGLLNNGEFLLGRLLNGFQADRGRAQLVSIATDGETYGHHHRFGEMALAYTLDKIERDNAAQLTNYGEFLEKFPAAWQVEIVENSSWSCSHGVERWRSDCGCRVGGRASWNQAWRAPLRDGLNWLRDELDALFEKKAAALFNDPWAARNDYIEVMFSRASADRRAFFERQQSHPFSETETVQALKLLEMQRHVQFMFTSCGWFFDDISGLEGQTVLNFAARAVQLAADAAGVDFEEPLLERLSQAKSNLPEMVNGAEVYKRFVKSNVTDLPRVAAHHAIGALLKEEPAEGKTYCYSYKQVEGTKHVAGQMALGIGRVRVVSEITQEKLDTAYAVLRLGGHDFQAVLKENMSEAAFAAAEQALTGHFAAEGMADVLRLLGQYFDPRSFTLQDLFLERRREALRVVISEMFSRYDGVYRLIVLENQKLMNYLLAWKYPIPDAFRLALQYVLTRDIEEILPVFQGSQDQCEKLIRIHAEADRFGATLPLVSLAEVIRKSIHNALDFMDAKPYPEAARQILRLLDLAEKLDLNMFLWSAENRFYKMWNTHLSAVLDPSKPDAPEIAPFVDLAKRFHLRLAQVQERETQNARRKT